MDSETKNYIDNAIVEAMRFSSYKEADTPRGATQVANKKYVDEHSFAGSITSGGAGTILPKGWTSAKTATGKYTVTHNLGHTSYAVVIGGVGIGFWALENAPTANTFDYMFLETSGVAGDRAAFFILRDLS